MVKNLKPDASFALYLKAQMSTDQQRPATPPCTWLHLEFSTQPNQMSEFLKI